MCEGTVCAEKKYSLPFGETVLWCKLICLCEGTFPEAISSSMGGCFAVRAHSDTWRQEIATPPEERWRLATLAPGASAGVTEVMGLRLAAVEQDPIAPRTR